MNQWQTLVEGLPDPCLLVGLTSIYWRESWKYGERAFRYCNLDVGHAIGAIAFAARILGWETRMLGDVADDVVGRLLGIHLQSGIEAEHADCLLLCVPAGLEPAMAARISGDWKTRIPDADFMGDPNSLSKDHHPWPIIEVVSQATRNDNSQSISSKTMQSDQPPESNGSIGERGHSAEQIIRQRRSAVDMDGQTMLDRDAFFRILQRTLPTHFPFASLSWNPWVSLAIFVHRVKDLEPGLYLLVRSESHHTSLRDSLKSDFLWQKPEGCPSNLNLFCLLSGDVQREAKMISCHQDIASHGVFSLGMLARFEAALRHLGPQGYPRLFWECGLIGQVLYLEAEAAGVRGTGIGCFFDDTMHDILGITDETWQSLYHFTVGAPILDQRLMTHPPYAHLNQP